MTGGDLIVNLRTKATALVLEKEKHASVHFDIYKVFLNGKINYITTFNWKKIR